MLVLGTAQACWAGTASFRVAPDDVKNDYLPSDIITIELTADFGVSTLGIDYIYGPPTATDLVLHEDFSVPSPPIILNSGGILFQSIAATTDMGGGDIAAGEVLLHFEYHVPDVPPSTIIEITAGGAFLADAVFSNIAESIGPVSMHVISEPTICTVPNVVGIFESPQMNPTNACTTLTNAGFVCGTRTTACHPTVPPGKIISTTPAAGAMVACGTSVNYVVSTGPCVCATCLGDLVPPFGCKNLSDMYNIRAKLITAYARTGIYQVEKGSPITGDLWHICGAWATTPPVVIILPDMYKFRSDLIIAYNQTGLYKVACPGYTCP